MPRPARLIVIPDATDKRVFWLRGTIAGQRIRRRAQSPTRGAAEREAITLAEAILNHAWHGDRRGAKPLAEAVLSYLDEAPRAAGDKRRLDRILAAVGDLRLAEIDQNTIDKARRKLLGPNPNPATVRRGIVTPLRAVMLHAAARGWCERPHFRIPREAKGRTLFLRPDEARRLVAAAAPHIRVLANLLLGSGMRMSEALELDWHEVSLAAGYARLHADQTKDGGERFVPLPPLVVAMLANLAHKRGPVILNHRGRPYADRGRQGGGQIKTAWAATLRRAGLDPAFTPHGLRHTWASWHYALYKDLLKLKVEGGWSSVALVERYAHPMLEGHTEAIKSYWLVAA